MFTNKSSKSGQLEIQVRKTILEYSMLVPGDHILVAVSGGADSTALLLCLKKLSKDFGVSLTVAHLNHRIRGAEADADEDFVRKLCCDLELPFVSEAMEVKQQARDAKQNLEEFARQKRYDFLRRTAVRVGAQKIAVGHNLNDQAETALFRFIRGSGIEGLSAIHPVVDGVLIRPLLGCSRASIREYLDQHGIGHHEDSTNKDLWHARNRIRQELVPYLEYNFNPQLVPIIAHEAMLARETWSFIESQALEAFKDLHCRVKDGISLKITSLLKLHPALQKEVLRQALKASLGTLRGISAVHIQSALSLCKMERSGDQVRLPHGSIAFRQFDALLFLNRLPEPGKSFAYRLDVPGQCRVAEAGALFRCTSCDAPNLKLINKKRSVQAYLNSSALPQSLTIRSRKPGDRYGGPGHRKVKKMLIDGKIPQSQRSALPMVAAGDYVIWIPGFRPARSYESAPESKTCILVEMLPEE